MRFIVWRDCADFLADVISKILNNSLKQQKLPRLWKLVDNTSISKVSPLSVSSQLRTISLKDIIMRIFERLVNKQEISVSLQLSIGSNQFSCNKEGLNTMTLLECQHQWLNCLNKGVDFVKVYYLDFSVAFDFVSHVFVRNMFKSCKGLITWAGLVSVCRDLGTFVKRNKTQLRDYMTTGPARLAEIPVSRCRDPG